MFSSFQSLQHYAEDDEGNARIEREVELTYLPKEEESKKNGVTRLKIIGEIDCEGRELFQCLDL